LLPAGSRVFDDPVAMRVVNPDSDAYRSRVALLESLPGPIRSRFTHFILRSRYAEDCLTEAVQQRGLAQYVILGAGLDTFAGRQPERGKPLRIFEVDHPATQEWKRRRLHEARIAIPENVQFAPIDFSDTTLADGLARAGFSSAVPTFFSMLGVSQYLAADALDLTFRLVLSLPKGSEIVFTIAVPDEMLRPEEVAFVARLTTRFAAMGEPWLTRPWPDQLAQRMSQMGFSSVRYLTSEDANRLYFSNRADDLKASEMG
jgi:methyltransferase (TIGR00027 family)